VWHTRRDSKPAVCAKSNSFFNVIPASAAIHDDIPFPLSYLSERYLTSQNTADSSFGEPFYKKLLKTGYKDNNSYMLKTQSWVHSTYKFNIILFPIT